MKKLKRPLRIQPKKKDELYHRLFKNLLISIAVIIVSLGVGVAGYSFFANLPFVDSLLNASMILTGMGPVDEMKTNAAKYFASFYALFSGITFLSSIAVLFAPMVQRMMFIMGLETLEEEEKEESEGKK